MIIEMPNGENLDQLLKRAKLFLEFLVKIPIAAELRSI